MGKKKQQLTHAKMHINMNLYISLFILCVFSFLSPLSSTATPATSTHNISAVFAFGDSTLDPGNNNFLFTPVRANHTPYGQDFPGGVPTGRFSNGKLITDFLVSSLGLKEFLPPFADKSLTTADLLTGVSFASAGSGLHNVTALMSRVTPILKQVDNFETYVETLTSLVGEEKTRRVVSKALFVIGAGSNDIIMNYYMNPITKSLFSVGGYHEFLFQKMRSLVQRLYTMGGRKYTIAGLPPLGCIPLEMSLAGQGLSPVQRSCVVQHNFEASAFNSKLEVMIKLMQHRLPGTKFAYVDIYNPLMDMVTYPNKYGFDETKLGCCGLGGVEMGPTCGIPFMPNCQDPSKHLFWDSVHPSQAAYEALANHLMTTVLSVITKQSDHLVMY